MKTLKECGVGKDKIQRISELLLCSGGLCKKEIAEKTNISVTTVGKAVSALLEKGFLNESEEHNPFGRKAKSYSPSEKFKLLIFSLSEIKIDVTLLKMDKSVIFSYSRPVNQSIPYENNIENTVFEVRDNLSKYTKDPFLQKAVIKDSNIKLSKQKDLADFLNGACVFDKTRAAANYIEKHFKNENVLYIDINETINALPVMCGKSAEAEKKLDFVSDSNEKELVSTVAKSLTSLFKIIIPDKIFITSDRFFINQNFVTALFDKTKELSGSKKENMPEIHLQDKLDISYLHVFEHISKTISVEIANQF